MIAELLKKINKTYEELEDAKDYLEKIKKYRNIFEDENSYRFQLKFSNKNQVYFLDVSKEDFEEIIDRKIQKCKDNVEELEKCFKII